MLQSQIEKTAEQKRQHHRVLADYQFIISKDGGCYYKARSINISQGGIMLCHLDGAFKAGDRIFLEVIDNKTFTHCLLVGRVAHHKQVDTGQFLLQILGVEFTQKNAGRDGLIAALMQDPVKEQLNARAEA